MEQYLVFALLGLGAGAVGAALGAGLVMTYKGTGTINFAHAALALWGAFAYDELRTSGHLVLPLPFTTASIPLGGPVPVWSAFIVALLLAAALGAATHLLVFRPLRRAPLAAKIIASLGLLTLLEGLLTDHFGQQSRFVPPLFPTTPIRLGGLSVPEDRLWIAGFVLVLTLAVSLVYRRTLFGLATTALREDEVALTLSRWSPTWLGVANVAGGVALTTSVMIVAASISPLNSLSVGLLVVPGLAAMLVGRLVHVVPAALTGLALGLVQGLLSFVPTKSWWPAWLSTGGATDAVPLLVIVFVLVVRGRSLPTRAGLVLDPLPRVPPAMKLRTIAVLGAAIAVLAVFLTPTLRLGLATSMVYAVLALSLVVLVGLVGQISLGQLAVAGIAAFTLAKYLDSWPFPLGLVVASLVAAVLAVLVGMPALRVRGAQLAVVTLSGAAAVQSLVLNNAESGGTGVEVTPPSIGPLDLGSQVGTHIGRLQFVYAVLAVLLVVCALTSRTIAGRLGRRFLAVRSNEQAAASVGINVVRTKILALGIAGFVAGLGGGLLAYDTQAVSADAFGVFLSITLLVYAYIGGITGVGGALYAGLLVPGGILVGWIGQYWNLGAKWAAISALSLILMAIQSPNGVSDATRVLISRLKRRLRPHTASVERTVVLPTTAVDPTVTAGLHVRNITVRYGGVVAVDNVSLEVASGEIVGLIGPNGAGKTSLLDALTGFARSEGSVEVGRLRLDHVNAHRRYLAGLGRTWQSGELFEDLDVFDNVRVAERRLARRARRRGASDADSAWAMRLLGIEAMAAKRPAEISGGRRKLVGVARALAGRPSVLLCDEPAAGLDSFESRRLGERLRSIAADGVAVLLIEHDLALVLAICDRIYVLEEGRVIASGDPEHVRRHPDVVRAYIGESITATEAAV
ncbi:ATP-binding cassette domain-containing protein [Cryptosporangium sp. NPDC051539]|uniref:ABC transporter permease subunit n=1 Tax=Cryptosporangium sp. NPDC051539 TaxID=3363962 RepID=UPI00379B20D0